MADNQIAPGDLVESFAPGNEPISTENRPAAGSLVESFPEQISTFSPAGMQDVATQIGHGLVYGAGDIASLPATLSQVKDIGASLARQGYGYTKEMLGYEPPGSTALAERKRQQQAYQAMSPSERAGKTASVFGYQLPTSAGMEDILQHALNLSAQPAQTTLGRYAGAATRALPLSAIGGPGTLLPRLAYGAASGMGAQAGEELGQAANSPLLSTMGAFVGGLAGPAALSKVQGFLSPSKQVIEELAKKTAQDVATTKGSLSQTVGPNGVPISPDTMIGQVASGPAARKFIGITVGKSPQSINELQALNEGLVNRGANINSNLSGFIKNLGGLPSDVLDAKAAKNVSEARNVSNLYNSAYSAPTAQAISDPFINNLINSNNTMKSIFNDVQDISRLPNSTIVSPVFDNAGNLVTPGNLEFYDRFGRILRDKINSLKMNGLTDQARAYQDVHNQYINKLDTLFPQYQSARGAAFVRLGAEDSFEAGRSALGQSDPQKIRDLKSAFNSSIPEHQQSFKDGLYFELQNAAENNGPKGVNKFFSNPERERFARSILGDGFVDAMKGRALADQTLSNVAPYNLQQSKSSLGTTITESSALGSQVNDVVNNLSQGAYGKTALSGLKAATIAGGIQGLRWLSGLQNDKKATALLTYLQSNDPARMAEFYNLVNKNKDAQNTLGRITDYARRTAASAPVLAAPHYETVPAHPAPDGSGAWTNLKDEDYRAFRGSQHATGGRIERASGGRAGLDHKSAAEALMRAAERAKKAENETTEPLLNLPDEAITKALSAANEAI